MAWGATVRKYGHNIVSSAITGDCLELRFVPTYKDVVSACHTFLQDQNQPISSFRPSGTACCLASNLYASFLNEQKNVSPSSFEFHSVSLSLQLTSTDHGMLKWHKVDSEGVV